MIFPTFDTFAAVVTVNASFKQLNFQLYVDRAARQFVIPFVSPQQYNHLVANLSNPAYATLLPLVRTAVANFAMYLAIPHIKVQSSGIGFVQSAGEGQKIARQEDVDDLQAAYLEAGQEALQEALALLEANTAPPFDLYHASPAATKFDALIIKTYFQFLNFSPVPVYRSVYHNAYGALLHVERKEVRPILGTALFDRLRTQLATGHYATLLNDYVSPIIVFRTLAKLAVTNSVIFNRQNTLTNFDNRQASESRGHFSAELERIKLFVDEMNTSADDYISELTPYLEANLANFPEYTVPDISTTARGFVGPTVL